MIHQPAGDGSTQSEAATWKRWPLGVTILLLVLYFVFIAIPAAPIAIVVLPVLLGLAYWGLRNNRRRETDGSLLETLSGRVSWRNSAGLLLVLQREVAHLYFRKWLSQGAGALA